MRSQVGAGVQEATACSYQVPASAKAPAAAATSDVLASRSRDGELSCAAS